MERRDTPPPPRDLRTVRALGLEATQGMEKVPDSDADLPPPNEERDEPMFRHPLRVITSPKRRGDALVAGGPELLPEDVPDVSLPLDAYAWRTPHWAAILLDVSSVEPRFMWQKAEQLRQGVHGRGKVDFWDGKLAVHFALTDNEKDGGRAEELLAEYRDSLLGFVGLSADTVIGERVFDLPDDVVTEAEASWILPKPRPLI